MLRNKMFVIFVLILIIVLIGVYFYLKSVKQNQVKPIDTILTEEERINILNELSSGSNSKPISETERQQILKDLNSGSASTSLTEEEKLSILNSLNSKQ